MINLRKQYNDEIRNWDWDFIKNGGEIAEDFDGDERCYFYLGSVMSLMPSGKYYMFWCTNQTWRDVVMDGLFMEILEEVADEHGGWIEGGEGDPTDLFFVTHVEEEEE